ncbi:alpha/beta hydrolase [Microbacterium sp.]|uniref:alpha/beta hydrolase n=1 Tax=Microbacterium sp. TaxID=51671 RepID=UPI003A90D350
MRHQNLDPELTAAVNLVPPVNFVDVELSRRLADEYSETKIPEDVLQQVDIQHVVLHPGVEGFLYRPRRMLTTKPSLPALLWMHGGGFVTGRPEHAGPFAVGLALELSIAVFVIHYRLAPEHPFPAGLDDSYAGYRSLVETAEQFNIDSSGIVVGGQSAGAALAAGLCLRLRDEGFSAAPIFQYLDIPVLDNRLITPSAKEFVDSPGWNAVNARLSWNHYLTDPADYLTTSPKYAAPAREEDLGGLPPAYISVAEVDPLRDEGIEYALRLLRAGVSTELHCFPGTFHGSTAVRSARVSRRSYLEVVDVLRGVYAHHQPHRSDALNHDLSST